MSTYNAPIASQANRDKLLQIAYNNEGICGLDHEQFQCLVVLIEDDYIMTIDQLRDYGNFVA